MIRAYVYRRFSESIVVQNIIVFLLKKEQTFIK